MTRRAEPDFIELRSDKPYDEESVGHVLHPNGSLIDSLHRGFLGAAARAVIGLWAQQPRVCVCAPTSRPVLVEPDDPQRCYRCGGGVVPRAPFRAGEWP